MASLLKTFGKGVLYILGLPFFLVILLLFAVAGLLIFLFQILKSIVFFFTGHKFFPELPEDRELRLLREGVPTSESEEEINETPDVFQDISNEDSFVKEEEPVKEEAAPQSFSTIEEACFGREEVKEEIKQEPISSSDEEDDLVNILASEEESSPIEEDTISLSRNEEHVVETSMEEKKISEPEEEILETYTPKSSDYIEVNEDDDTDNGVNINFDDL